MRKRVGPHALPPPPSSGPSVLIMLSVTHTQYLAVTAKELESGWSQLLTARGRVPDCKAPAWAGHPGPPWATHARLAWSGVAAPSWCAQWGRAAEPSSWWRCRAQGLGLASQGLGRRGRRGRRCENVLIRGRCRANGRARGSSGATPPNLGRAVGSSNKMGVFSIILFASRRRRLATTCWPGGPGARGGAWQNMEVSECSGLAMLYIEKIICRKV